MGFFAHMALLLKFKLAEGQSIELILIQETKL